MKGRKLRHRLTALLLAFGMIFTAVAVRPSCDAFAAGKARNSSSGESAHTVSTGMWDILM